MDEVAHTNSTGDWKLYTAITVYGNARRVQLNALTTLRNDQHKWYKATLDPGIRVPELQKYNVAKMRDAVLVHY